MLRSAFLAAAGAVLALAAFAPAHAETTVRAVSFIPKNNPVMNQANAWVAEVNAALKGEFQINYVGGPEVVPRYQLADAVRNNIVPIIFPAGGDLQDEMPQTLAYTLSKLSPSEERKSGFYDYMVGEVAKKYNARYLGRVQMSPFYFWLKKEPKALADLKGLKMRTGSLYDKFMKALGMTPVNINAPETFTALEGGVVDGLGWPVSGMRQQGWNKHVKFVVDLPFYGQSNIIAMLSHAEWNKLKPDVQKKLVDVTAAFEPKMVAYYTAENEKEWGELEKAGMKRVKFSEAENKQYLDTAYNVEWAWLESKLGKDETAKLRKLTGN